TVGPPDGAGRRPVAVHSRPDSADGDWTRHASGQLAADPGTDLPPFPGAWPPAGATEIDLEALAAQVADAGLDYGPAFQGLRAAWRQGADTYVEVGGAAVEAGHFGLHPALLDAALRPLAPGPEPGSVRMPFSWSGVRWLGASPDTLRVRLTE